MTSSALRAIYPTYCFCYGTDLAIVAEIETESKRPDSFALISTH